MFSDFPCAFFVATVVLLNFYKFVNFPLFLLLLISNFMPLWLEKILSMRLTLWNLLRFICGLFCGLSWRRPHMPLRRTGVCRSVCLFDLIGWLCCSHFLPMHSSCLVGYASLTVGYWRFQLLYRTMSPLSSIHFYFMCFDGVTGCVNGCDFIFLLYWTS